LAVNRVVSFSAASKDYQSGRYVKSLETLNSLLETQKDAKVYVLLGRTLQQLGMKADAAMAFSLAGEKAGASGAEFSRKAALLHFEAGNEDDAQRLGLRYMLQHGLDAEIAYMLASIYLQRGQDELLSPFCKVLAESSNLDHTRLAVRMLRNNPSDVSQAFLARNLFKRFPKLIQFRLLYLMFSRDVSDLSAIALHKPAVDELVKQGERDFLKHESEFYNLQWCGDEALNRQAWSINHLQSEDHSVGRRATPHQWAEKIRIGYLSNDFFEQHATIKLLGRVLELHDRDRFEVTLYCHTKQTNLDHSTIDRDLWGRIVTVRDMSNEAVAKLMRADGIDILVDLKGPTFETRYGILNHGAAPVQVSWLGFPGSASNTDLDYIIGDKFVLPETSKPHYHEKFLHMPDTYQPNDPVHRPLPRPVYRAQFDLPEDKFVFASFNASRKVTPETVNVWCNILRRVPESVLWLMAVSPASEANLREYFKRQGIPAKRIVFCGHADYQAHIDRQQAADLALDTWPYNGHTTTSEQLWGGLPVLTLKGTNFASRVSESLLNAIGLPELVAADVQAYEDMAVDLANNRERVAGFKETLEANRLIKPLFDAERFCRHLETAYEMIVDRAKQGLDPDHITVPALPARMAPFGTAAG
jgi:predicted O-linked N-acetylglucosamine transferase (SPINDLY family)